MQGKKSAVMFLFSCPSPCLITTHVESLSLQGYARRVITAMNLAVTVGAILRNNQATATRVRIVVIQKTTDMRTRTTGNFIRMALLAQLWTGFVQQRLVIRAMHVVAEGAVF